MERTMLDVYYDKPENKAIREGFFIHYLYSILFIYLFTYLFTYFILLFIVIEMFLLLQIDMNFSPIPFEI